eukprot:5184391-Amphidinium_carterae.1
MDGLPQRLTMWSVESIGQFQGSGVRRVHQKQWHVTISLHALQQLPPKGISEGHCKPYSFQLLRRRQCRVT